MNVLLIGFGSIGKRHYEVLKGLETIKNIEIVTKQDLIGINTYKAIEDIVDLSYYEYFIISSETSKHFEQLSFINQKVKNKLIFCEKPLFENKSELKNKNNNIYVGYVLRFHPLLVKLKDSIKNEKIISITAKSGQYLPSWRPNVDYRKTYSAYRNKGGGVLLDLSHEIDYVHWLAGELDEIKSYQVKISDLEIDSDDFSIIIGKTKKSALVNVSIDYISKKTHRRLFVETLNYTYELDFISNILTKKDKLGLEKNYNFSNLERNHMFLKMHLDILNNKEYACEYNEALSVMNTITIVQEQNNE